MSQSFRIISQIDCSIRADKLINFTCQVPQPYNKIGDGPEGPEVRVVTEYLNQHYQNKLLIKIECQDVVKYFAKDEHGFNTLVKFLPCQLIEVFCKGKQIYFHLQSSARNNYQNIYLYSHLRMTGRWIDPQVNQLPTTIKAKLVFGRKLEQSIFLLTESELWYSDTRGLGQFKIFWDQNNCLAKLNSLGPDLLAQEVSFEQWSLITKRFKGRSLVSFLMNQDAVCGIGNYLKAEILYAAKLRPDRKVGNLTEEENRRLWCCSIQKIRESYSYGGLTISDYWDPVGRKGCFPINVYGKERDPYGNIVERHKFADGRTTHWVPAIQH